MQYSRNCFALLIACLVLTGISGCAFDLARIKYEPVEIDVSAASELNSFVLLDSAHIYNSPCGYDRTLRADTRWDPIGRIPQGNVYSSSNQTLTVECSNIFEVYIVVNDLNQLVGGYLPVEDSFVALKKPIPLHLLDN